MKSILKIAWHTPTEKFMHVDNASNGLSCNCECLKCGEKLEAKQGEIRAKHFSHYVNKNCEGSQETALHELGKQILVENSQIRVPEHGQISYSGAVSEQRYERIRPDVTAKYEGKAICFEIFVSNAVDENKDKYIKDNELRSVEIDLSQHRGSTIDEIKHCVLDSTENKRIIFWGLPSVNQPVLENSGCLLQILLFIVVLVGLAWF